jgi:hypothetical protein
MSRAPAEDRRDEWVDHNRRRAEDTASQRCGAVGVTADLDTGCLDDLAAGADVMVINLRTSPA